MQMLMGHQHYSTTIDIYTHVTETKFEEEIAKFGSVSEKQKVQKNKTLPSVHKKSTQHSKIREICFQRNEKFLPKGKLGKMEEQN